MALNLHLPQVAAQADPEVEIRSVYVEEWVDALPYANSGVLMRELQDALQKLNRSPLKPSLRLELLEHYRQPCLRLLQNREVQTSAVHAGTFEKVRAETGELRQLLAELANGYKRVLSDSLTGRSRWGKNKTVATATQRSIHCLVNQQLLCFEQYHSIPAALWRELGELWAFAEKSGFHQQSGKANASSADAHLSPENLYKQILLCSLVDPCHLAYGAIWKISRLLTSYTDKAVFQVGKPIDKLTGLFLVPTNGEAPSPCREAPTAVDSCQLLDTSPLLTALRTQLELPPKSHSSETHALLQHMVRAFSLPPQRHLPRAAGKGEVLIASGLSTLHHYLGEGSTDTTTGIAGNEPHAETGDADDIEIGLPDNEFTSGPAIHSYATESWEITNEGPGGVGMLRQLSPGVTPRVGELVGIRSQPETRWSIGVVRWLNIGENGAHQAGVQLLGKKARAVMLRPTESKASALNQLPALVLAAADDSGKPTLLIPAGIYAAERPMRVTTSNGATHRIVLERCLDNSGNYERVDYRAANNGGG